MGTAYFAVVFLLIYHSCPYYSWVIVICGVIGLLQGFLCDVLLKMRPYKISILFSTSLCFLCSSRICGCAKKTISTQYWFLWLDPAIISFSSVILQLYLALLYSSMFCLIQHHNVHSKSPLRYLPSVQYPPNTLFLSPLNTNLTLFLKTHSIILNISQKIEKY